MTGSTKDPFDERAALAELERFSREIERYKSERQSAERKFDKFVESFPAPEDVFPTEAPAARARQVTQSPPPETIALPPLPKREAKAAPVVVTPPAAADVKGPAPIVPEARPRKRTPILAALVVVLVAAGAFAVWTFRGAGNTPLPQTTAPPAAAPAPQSPPASAPPPAAPVESEITTIRRAWVRVIADGERVVERELPADTRIPFKADKTIVVRTGDAGAVKQ
jgi:hypothetical protein